MFITIQERFGRPPSEARSQIFLTWDTWNDYNYRTLFGIYYVDSSSSKIELGTIHIAFKGQDIGEPKLSIGESYTDLPESYFSLGSISYYKALNNLNIDEKKNILIALKDIVYDDRLFDEVINEPVTQASLLRSITISTIKGQFKRILNGGAELTPFEFYFKTKIYSQSTEFTTLAFNVIPESYPPTNINVLIGRNGTGKTTIISKMVSCFLQKDKESEFGESLIPDFDIKKHIFPVLINVSFSAFDNTNKYIEDEEVSDLIKYYYVGLRKRTPDNESGILLKSIDELTNEFLVSINSCREKLLKDRWLKALYVLQSDPNFKDQDLTTLIELDYTIEDEKERKAEYEKRVISIFSSLSSGHKIVLLSITRIVELIEEKSLILIDEPETHLHPPLLSAFIRALSELLINRNGVAIIATHSPVILQEVPSSCVWKLIRYGDIVKSNRLRIESFGENVGVLTHEVFNLEVINSGFHKILEDVVNNTESYDEAITLFKDQIGLEAKAILQSYFYQKRISNDSNS